MVMKQGRNMDYYQRWFNKMCNLDIWIGGSDTVYGSDVVWMKCQATPCQIHFLRVASLAFGNRQMYSWAFCKCSLNEIVMKYGRNGLSMKYGLLSTKCIAYGSTGIRRCWMCLQQSRFYFFVCLMSPLIRREKKSWDAFKPLKLSVAAQEIYFSTTIHI